MGQTTGTAELAGPAAALQTQGQFAPSLHKRPGAAQAPDNDPVDAPPDYLVPRSLGSVGCLRSVLTDVNDGS